MGRIELGEPFWSGFTAFFTNEAALFTLDKLDLLDIQRFWLATVASLCIGAVVYGRAKVAELRKIAGAEHDTRELDPGDY
jgi:hypothetical protein